MATMQVLLREDIEELGHRGEIVRVKAGYARNYLLPRKLAIIATQSNVKAIEQERKTLDRRERTERDAAKTLAEKLQEISLEFERKASEQGVFYGSVTTHDIAQALSESGMDIERRKLHLSSPIKQPGRYSVRVKLHRDVLIDVPIQARAEAGQETAESQMAENAAQTTAPSPAQEEADAGAEDQPILSQGEGE